MDKTLFRYEYKTLTKEFQNKSYDGRRRYGIASRAVFAAGSKWRVYWQESDTKRWPVLYYGEKSYDFIGPLNPEYKEMLEALVDREPTLTELLEEGCTDAQTVLEAVRVLQPGVVERVIEACIKGNQTE